MGKTYPEQVRAAERAMRKRRRGRGKVSMAALRIAELEREFSDRYGAVLSDDDAGRDDVTIMLNHIARRPDAADRMAAWLDRRAPWFVGDERARLCALAIGNPLRYRADTLGRKLGLTAARRAELGIRTIGAVDQTSEERREARRLAKRDAKRQARRARGCKVQADSRRRSIERSAPWDAAGISRATWYRQRRETAAAPV